MATHTFTRQELYDLVWSEPMIKLAARYRISGNGLAKACRRADIPVPERGYWNKLQAGKKVVPTTLPKAKAETPRSVTINPPLPQPEQPPPAPTKESVAEKIEAERKAVKPVNVAATLAGAHRIVAGWIEQHRREYEAHRHDAVFTRMHVPIDKTMLGKRRLRILSALFKALEARNYRLIVEDSRYSRAVEVAAGEEKFGIQLEEYVKQVRSPLTEEEKAARGFLSSGKRWKQERIPTGLLRLHIGGGEWSDTPDAPLENKLDEVLPFLAGAFEERRLQRVRQAEEQRRRWQAEEERRQAEMERKRETVRFRRLLGHCEDWRAAADIRALVAESDASRVAAVSPERFAAWKIWALEHADRLDPFAGEELFDREVSDYEVYALKD